MKSWVLTEPSPFQPGTHSSTTRSVTSVVSLGDRCPGDFNQDDVVNTLDVLAFLNAWTAGCP